MKFEPRNKYTLGQEVYGYTPYKSVSYIRAKVVTGIRQLTYNCEYQLDGKEEWIDEEELFDSSYQLVLKLIEEEVRIHNRRISELVKIMNSNETSLG